MKNISPIVLLLFFICDSFFCQTASFARDKNYTRDSEIFALKILDKKKADRESFYLVKALAYKRQRNALICAMALVFLIFLILALVHIKVRQRRRCERLLNEENIRELALINSHKVRRHLANILGLCTILNEFNPSSDDIPVYHEHLFNAACCLDQSLNEVDQKIERLTSF